MRSKKVQDINFKFVDFVEKELKERAAFLYQVLRTEVFQTAIGTLPKLWRRKMAAGLHLKAINKDMCLTQVVTSLILHNGELSQMVRF